MKHRTLTPTETLRLQNMVRKLEDKIIKLAWRNRDESVMVSVAEACEDEKKAEKLETLLQDRCYCLNALFKGTEDEYRRLSALNDRLRDLTAQMKCKAEVLLDALGSADPEWLKDSSMEIELIPKVPDSYSVSEADKFYNSDFNAIINIECAFMLVCEGNIDNIASNSYINGKFSCGVAELDSEIEDWKEGRLLWMDETKPIKWCWALHQLDDHLRFPYIDILQLKEFDIHLTFDSNRNAKGL